MFGLSPMELVIVGVIAVLLFGERLPEVGRSLGKSLIEFKKGLNEIKSEMNSALNATPSSITAASHHNPIDDYETATAPKFEPPLQEPTVLQEPTGSGESLGNSGSDNLSQASLDPSAGSIIDGATPEMGTADSALSTHGAEISPPRDPHEA